MVLLVRSSFPLVTHPPGAEEAATEHEDGSDSDDDPLPGSRGHSPFSSRLAPRRLVGEASASGAGASFPMYVIRVSEFLRLERLTTHNELLRRGLLRQLDDTFDAHVHFVSHQARATAVLRVAPHPRRRHTTPTQSGEAPSHGVSPPAATPHRHSRLLRHRAAVVRPIGGRPERGPHAHDAGRLSHGARRPARRALPLHLGSSALHLRPRGSSGAFLQPARTRSPARVGQARLLQGLLEEQRALPARPLEQPLLPAEHASEHTLLHAGRHAGPAPPAGRAEGGRAPPRGGGS